MIYMYIYKWATFFYVWFYLLETCVKNCGKRFHLHIATKDFLNDLVKVINPKNNPSMATQIMVLGLIQVNEHSNVQMFKCFDIYSTLFAEYYSLDMICLIFIGFISQWSVYYSLNVVCWIFIRRGRMPSARILNWRRLV